MPVAPVRLNNEVPADLERIINKALEKDRDLRYQHAADIRTDLKRLKRETESSSGVMVAEDVPQPAPAAATSGSVQQYRIRAAGWQRLRRENNL